MGWMKRRIGVAHFFTGTGAHSVCKTVSRDWRPGDWSDKIGDAKKCKSCSKVLKDRHRPMGTQTGGL